MDLVAAVIAFAVGVATLIELPIWAMQWGWFRRWATLLVIIAAGAATVCIAYLLLRYEAMAGHADPKPAIDTRPLVFAPVPTVLFLVANFMCWQSIKMQRAMAEAPCG
jgi:hypothetical protein